MRASHVTKTRKTASNGELSELAAEFIKNAMESRVGPSWLNDDGSYDWHEAVNAHLSDLPLARIAKMDTQTHKVLSKIHYGIWLRLEDERLEGLITSLEERRADLRKRLVTLDVYE